MAALTDDEVLELAGRIAAARETRRPIPALTSELPKLSMADAYRIQHAQIEARMAGGERLAGWKVGALNAASRALGMTEPFMGPIFASTVYPSGASIPAKDLIEPGLEPEIAFLIGRRLTGPGVTFSTALPAIEGVLGVLEIADCRYLDWKFAPPDMPADCGCGAGLVVGSQTVPLEMLDLPQERLIWELDGEILATATGAEVGGTPLASLVWLANRLAEWDMALEPGHFIAAGALSPTLRLGVGHSVRASFTHLGSVSARFV